MPMKPKPKNKVMRAPASKRNAAAKRMGAEGPKGKPKRTISYPPPMKDKKAPKRETAAKRVVKASAGSAANLARSGEAQRREMARTRLVQQQGRMTAAERRKVTERQKRAGWTAYRKGMDQLDGRMTAAERKKVTERNKDIKLNKIHRATARINRRSSY